MRYLDKHIQPHLELFNDLKKDLKKSGLRKSLEEYLSMSIFTCIILFIVELPVLSLIFSLLGLGFFFSFFMGITTSVLLCAFFFLLFTNYPKFIIRDKAREIDRTLPFAGIYLSSIASSRLPPHQIFEIFSKFKEYGQLNEEIKKIVSEVSEIPAEELKDDAEFGNELEIDSMMALEIVAKIEKEYKVTIPEEEIPKVRSLKNIYELLKKRIKK